MAETKTVFFNITDYGAIPDGATDSTKAIQNAIEDAYKNGGGYVTVPAGSFLSGTVELKSHVYLMMSPGSILLGSMDIADFRAPKKRMAGNTAFILAEEATNCGVIGAGTIDLRRQDIGYTKEHGRPCLMLFSLCTEIEVSGVSLIHTGFFTIYACGCVGCRFSKLIIDSTNCENGDGIDVSGSRNITISDCRITTGDDAIGLKTHIPEEPCENITITNCILTTNWGGIRLGPETCGDFKHITMSNCVFIGCSDGVKVQLCDSYNMENLTFSNLNMRNVRRPFLFTNTSCPMSGRSGHVRPRPGKFRRVLVSDVVCQCAVCENNWFESIATVWGLPKYPVEDVTFRNIYIVSPTDAKEQGATIVPEIFEYSNYPDLIYLSPRFPSALMFIKNASRIKIDGAVLESENGDVRPAIVAEAVDRLTITDTEERGCGALLRHTGISDLYMRECSGEVITLTDEQEKEWKDFREFSLKEDELIEENALNRDVCGKRPDLATFDITGKIDENFDLPEGSDYLVVVRAVADIAVSADGKEIYCRKRSEYYGLERTLVIPLPQGSKSVNIKTTIREDGKISVK